MSAAALGAEPSDVIRRPDTPSHYMLIADCEGTVVVRVGADTLASSQRAIVVHEVHKGVMSPRYYLPRGDVTTGALRRTETQSHCPLKGDASYFDLTCGALEIPDAVWSYEQVLDFDPRIERLRGMVSFDTRYAKVELR